MIANSVLTNSHSVSQFAQEADAAKWTHRLHIYGLDFRDLGQLEAFCAFVCVHYDRLDAIVNNGMHL
jgi:hypothetical protein